MKIVKVTRTMVLVLPVPSLVDEDEISCVLLGAIERASSGRDVVLSIGAKNGAADGGIVS